jgi:hypothetical protein
MQSVVVNVKKKLKTEPEPRKAHFSFNFPETTQETVETYGEDLALKLIRDSITSLVQAPARKVLEAMPLGTEEEYTQAVSKHMEGFKIEIKRRRGASAPKVSAYQQVAHDLADPTKRDELIARFRALGITLDLNTHPASLPDPTADLASDMQPSTDEEVAQQLGRGSRSRR